MKLKKEVCLRKVVDEYILVPIGKTIDEYNGLFKLSETGAVLFEAICNGKEGAELVNALTEQFDVDESTAKKDVTAFLASLSEFGMI